MLLRYIVSHVTVQGHALAYKAFSLWCLINHLQSPFLFIFISLIIRNRFPIVSSSSTLNPPLLYFNLAVAHPDQLHHCHINPFEHPYLFGLLLSCWEKSYPYPSLLLNLYWTLGWGTWLHSPHNNTKDGCPYLPGIPELSLSEAKTLVREFITEYYSKFGNWSWCGY